VICPAFLRFTIDAVLGGVPLIGPVPGVEGLMLATGHEGSGLCMVCFLPCSMCTYSIYPSQSSFYFFGALMFRTKDVSKYSDNIRLMLSIFWSSVVNFACLNKFVFPWRHYLC